MNKKRKLLIVLINLVLILFLISNTVFGSIIDEFEKSVNVTGTGTDDLKTTGGKILGVIRVVGTIISVAMLMIIGIKYMLGSSQEKAEYKKSLFPYVIGAILLFASTSLADVIYTWVGNL